MNRMHKWQRLIFESLDGKIVKQEAECSLCGTRTEIDSATIAGECAGLLRVFRYEGLDTPRDVV